jgi:hypothetical protein
MARMRTLKQEYQAALQAIAMAKLTIQRAVVRFDRDILPREEAIRMKLTEAIVEIDVLFKETE